MAREGLTVEDPTNDTYISDDAATTPVDEQDQAPYAMSRGMSVPVPKKMGKWWKAKIDDAGNVYEMEWRKWDAIYEQYRLCGDEGGITTSNGETYKYHLKNNTDENIIRTNIHTIMRQTYMRNPHLEFTGSDTDQDLSDFMQYTLNFLMNKKTEPGLNVKPKARRWILHGQMTNFGILRLDYQPKDGSLDQARENLAKVEKDLQKAKSKDEIDDCMAQLQLLYEQLPILCPKGMQVANVLPHRLIVDPDCTHIDLSDAAWVAEEVHLDRDWVNNKFYEKNDDGQEVLLSNPEHTKRQDKNEGNSVEDSVLQTVMNDTTEQRKEYINKNKIRCYYIYDKTTRRVYLFSDEDWSYPLWVFDDDLRLSRFFRHYIINFSEPVDGIVQPGEASFYIGHVATINQINRKAQEIRNSVFGALMYDKSSVDITEVNKMLQHIRNPDGVKAFAIAKTNGENKKMSEMVEAFAPPAIEYEKLFDTTNMRAVISRTMALSDVDQGAQFKTNTTNDAVQYMAQNKASNIGTIVDSIEDSFEELGWSMAEILVSKYSKDDITLLVGPQWAEKFTPMSVQEFNQRFRMTVVGGSIEKPDSEFKKKEAIQIAQALGQIGQSAPVTTMKLIVRMFQKAFSGFLMKDSDWGSLEQEGQANLTKGVSTNGPPTSPQPKPAGPVQPRPGQPPGP